MQKFGLRRVSNDFVALRLAIAKEQASSLGRTGRKLRLSLEKYEIALHANLAAEEKINMLEDISNNVWELMLQREFLGFIEGNLRWVEESYAIPSEVICMLGTSKSR